MGSCLLKKRLILLAAEDMRRQSARILPRGDRKQSWAVGTVIPWSMEPAEPRACEESKLDSAWS